MNEDIADIGSTVVGLMVAVLMNEMNDDIGSTVEMNEDRMKTLGVH